MLHLLALFKHVMYLLDSHGLLPCLDMILFGQFNEAANNMLGYLDGGQTAQVLVVELLLFLEGLLGPLN